MQSIKRIHYECFTKYLLESQKRDKDCCEDMQYQRFHFTRHYGNNNVIGINIVDMKTGKATQESLSALYKKIKSNKFLIIVCCLNLDILNSITPALKAPFLARGGTATYV